MSSTPGPCVSACRWHLSMNIIIPSRALWPPKSFKVLHLSAPGGHAIDHREVYSQILATVL